MLDVVAAPMNDILDKTKAFFKNAMALSPSR